MTDTPLLHQLRISHFNEKARWALDYKGVPHERRTSPPAWHVVTAMRLTRRQTFPILVTPQETLPDSSDIVAWLEREHPDPPLYPDDPAERERALGLEAYLGDEVGPDVRRIFFWHSLAEEADSLCATYTAPMGSLAGRAYTLSFGVTKLAMRRAMSVNETAVEESKRKVAAGLDRIEAELGDGDYLVGDRFSVADLTASALFFPLTQPPEFQYDYAAPMAPGLRRYTDEISDRRAIAWTREMWSRHRGASAEV